MAYKLKENEQFLVKKWRNIEYIKASPQGSLVALKQENGSYMIFSVLKDDKKAIYIARDEDELKTIKKMATEYSQYVQNLMDFQIFGERKLDNCKIYINKSQTNDRVSISYNIFDNDKNAIGCREINPNPFTTYLRLGIHTVSGGSMIEEEYIGKGFGKFLYDTVDKTLPYQQIPHGYADACGSLTDYSKSFWEKRSKYRPMPVINPDVSEILDYIGNMALYVKNTNQHFPYVSEDYLLRLYNTMDKGYEMVIHDDKCCPLCLYPEYKDSPKIIFDDLKEIIRQRINTYVSKMDINQIFSDLNDFMAHFQTLYPSRNALENPIIREAVEKRYNQIKHLQLPENIQILHKYDKEYNVLDDNEYFYTEKKGDIYSIGILVVDGKHHMFRKEELFKTDSFSEIQTKIDNVNNFTEMLHDTHVNKKHHMYLDYSYANIRDIVEGIYFVQLHKNKNSNEQIPKNMILKVSSYSDYIEKFLIKSEQEPVRHDFFRYKHNFNRTKEIDIYSNTRAFLDCCHKINQVSGPILQINRPDDYPLFISDIPEHIEIFSPDTLIVDAQTAIQHVSELYKENFPETWKNYEKHCEETLQNTDRYKDILPICGLDSSQQELIMSP